MVDDEPKVNHTHSEGHHTRSSVSMVIHSFPNDFILIIESEPYDTTRGKKEAARTLSALSNVDSPTPNHC